MELEVFDINLTTCLKSLCKDKITKCDTVDYSPEFSKIIMSWNGDNSNTIFLYENEEGQLKLTKSSGKRSCSNETKYDIHINNNTLKFLTKCDILSELLLDSRAFIGEICENFMSDWKCPIKIVRTISFLDDFNFKNFGHKIICDRLFYYPTFGRKDEVENFIEKEKENVIKLTEESYQFSPMFDRYLTNNSKHRVINKLLYHDRCRKTGYDLKLSDRMQEILDKKQVTICKFVTCPFYEIEDWHLNYLNDSIFIIVSKKSVPQEKIKNNVIFKKIGDYSVLYNSKHLLCECFEDQEEILKYALNHIEDKYGKYEKTLDLKYEYSKYNTLYQKITNELLI